MGVCGFSRFGFNQPPGLPETCLFKDVLLRWDGNGACLGLPRAPELQRVSLSDALCQNAFDWSMVLCWCMVFGSSSIDPQVFLKIVRLRWCTHLLNRHTKQHERGSHLFQLAPRTQSALWAVPPLRHRAVGFVVSYSGIDWVRWASVAAAKDGYAIKPNQECPLWQTEESLQCLSLQVVFGWPQSVFLTRLTRPRSDNVSVFGRARSHQAGLVRFVAPPPPSLSLSGTLSIPFVF